MADFQGGGARDTFSGTAQADVMSGGDGADTLFGGAGDDRLHGHSPGDADPATGMIWAQRVAAGLSNPLYAASPPGLADSLYVVEQHTGRVRILDLASNTVQATPFLDIADVELSRGGGQGLLGLAFHPDYAANGRFFINLTNAAGDTEIWEYRRSGVDPNVADPASRRLVLGYDQPFANHNGGWIGFGPDGLLYIASGDGGDSGDPFGSAQNIESLLGKVLRIDVNGDAFPTDAGRNYAIPAGNPFASSAGADEVFAYGLRNPWRISFDPLTGALYIADVGQGAREELNYLAPGAGAGVNFGWDFREGFAPFSGSPPAGLTGPVLDYPHGSGPYAGRSVTGGYVYRGDGGAQGLYVFADFASGAVWTVRVEDGVAQDFLNRNSQIVTDAGTVNQIASFAVDGRGRLYVVGLDGEVHRLTPGLTAGDAGDSLAGEAGADTIDGGVGADVITGDVGDDSLRGLADPDVISGGDGRDSINGNTGADAVWGDDGADWVLGGQDADVVHGGAGDDPHVNGNRGDDHVIGGLGSDTVYGGQDQDVLHGEDGADWLSGDLGQDLLFGGAGADRFLTRPGSGFDWVGDFDSGAGDRVQLAPGTAYSLTTWDGQVVVNLGGGDMLGLAGVTPERLGAEWLVFG